MWTLDNLVKKKEVRPIDGRLKSYHRRKLSRHLQGDSLEWTLKEGKGNRGGGRD